MAASQNIARLGIVLGLDSGELVTKITEAQQKFGKFKAQIKRDSEDAAKEIVRLEMATRNYGKTLTEVEKVEEQIRLGKYKHQPEIIISNLMKQAAAYDKVAAAAKSAQEAQMGPKGGLTAQQQAALGYQTTDIITSLAGGQNPMMVLLQQGGQLRDQFGGFKPLFQGIATALTPMRLAVAGFGASVLGVGYAFYQATQEQKAFQNSLVLTNNYAGVTAKTFDDLSSKISDKYKISLGDSKDAMQAIVSSGKFTSETLESVGSLVARMSKLTGESAEETAKSLIPALDGTASSAKSLNDRYHFLSAAQYQQIRILEAQGEKQAAIKITADALTSSISKQGYETNGLGKAWDEATRALDGYWQKFKNIAKTESPEESIQRLKNRISYLQSGDQTNDVNKSALEGAQEQLRLMQKMQTLDQEALDKKAKADAANQKKIDDEVSGRNAKRRDKEMELQKLINDEKYNLAATSMDKVAQIEAKRQRDIEDAKLEYAKKNIDELGVYSGLNKKILIEKEKAINADAAKQTSDLYRESIKFFNEKAKTEQDSIDMEQEKIAIYRQNVLSSKEDLALAESRLKTQHEIAEVMNRENMSEQQKSNAIEQIRWIGEERDALIRQQETLKQLQEVNAAVYSNMTTALQNFVRTGKLSFQDFAKGVINELINIQIRAMAMKMTSALGNMFAFSGSGGQVAYADGTASGMTVAEYFKPRASGGPVSGGSPYLVGEQGPELFVPPGSGTIMPTGMLGSMAQSGPTINYNGPYIASMSAIDTQSATQFLAKNKMAVWSANQSANRSVPSSR